MTLKQMEYFVTIIDTGSISAAAARLHISQPPLSIQIRSLEEELGTVLLDRNTRHLRPTDEGHRFYERARQILDLADAAKSEMLFSENHIEGTLRIGVISSCWNIFLSPALQQFAKDYPKVDFELVEGHTYSMLDKLKKRELDLTFVRTPFDEESYDCTWLREEPLCAVGLPSFFPDFPWDKESISLQDLGPFPLLAYRRYESLIRDAFRHDRQDLHLRCLAEDARTCLQLAGTGLGIAIIPRSISTLIPIPGIRILPLEDEQFMTRVALIHRKNQYLSQAAVKFIQALSTGPDVTVGAGLPGPAASAPTAGGSAADTH